MKIIGYFDFAATSQKIIKSTTEMWSIVLQCESVECGQGN